MSTWTTLSMPESWGSSMPLSVTTPTSRSAFKAMRSTGSKALFSTVFAIWTGRRETCDDDTAPEFPATGELNPDVIAGQRELRGFLSNALKTLPDRYQTVIGLYYLGGKTMREIGDRLGINESRVSQIHRAALDKMSANLHAAGIRSTDSLL